MSPTKPTAARRGFSLLLVILLLVALPLLGACAPHKPPQGPVISAEELRNQFTAAEASRQKLVSLLEQQDWAAMRPENVQFTAALNAMGPAVFANDSSVWYSIVDSKFDLDGQLASTKPSRSSVAEDLNALAGRLRTAGFKLGLVK